MRMRTACRGAALAVVGAALAMAPAAGADVGGANDPGGDRVTYAVIGDTPYGAPQLEGFPADVAEINADPTVSRVIHLGDIKNGSSVCSDDYLARIRGDFDAFDDPLVFTPGDNEWTDCHRPNNGAYDPIERLGAIRSIFFDDPGRTLGGHSARVDAQAAPGVENVRWHAGRVVFATAHVVGSNNGWALWTGRQTRPPAQVADVEARTAAAVAWIAATFAEAHRRQALGVVIGIQADMWDPAFTGVQDDPSQYDRFTPIVRELASQARAFGRPVLLLNGDSHVYADERPLADAARPHLRTMYGIASPVPNLRRVTVNGSTTPCHEWLRMGVDPDSVEVFALARVRFATQPGFSPALCPTT